MSEPLQTILILNSGSSSLKFSLFLIKSPSVLQLLYQGQLINIGGTGELQICSDSGKILQQQFAKTDDHKQALQCVLQWLDQHTESANIVAVGHRVVHGGLLFHAPIRISEDVLSYLETLIALAPNHQPANLHAIKLLMEIRPDLPQIACFDTAFHSTRPEIEQRFALPEIDVLKNVRRYGFHGLSYEYIAHVLPNYLGNLAEGKVVVAHLGNGASLCAMESRRSVATTMTFTPLDGIPMGTRSGSIDPAVVLYLQQQGMTHQQISDLLYFQSGLLGVSGISGDVETLLKRTTPEAHFALELFVHHSVRAIGSLAAALGGIDALVFTGGIGEHAASIRTMIIDKCAWLGLILDENANQHNSPCITQHDSPLSAWVIPTDEEYMIAQHCYDLIRE